MTAPQSIGKKFAQLEAETLRQWKSWAEAIADGGAAPTPIDVLQAAAVLAIDGPPAAALEADAEAITLVANLEERAAERQARYDELVQQHGGRDGIAVKLVEATEELRRLQGIEQLIVAGPGGDHHRKEARRIRSEHPRIFQEGAR